MRRWVSLGGWCGPSLVLSKLQLRPESEALPFDLVRCTLDGVAHFTRAGFADYFPRAVETGPGLREIPMDPVSIWLLFRGPHTCFTHYDLNAPAVRAIFEARIRRWDAMLRSDAPQRVTFLRTVIAADPGAEAAMVPQLQRALDEASGGRLDHRIALVMHDVPAHRPPQPLRVINDRAVVFSLPHAPGEGSLLDRTEAGYREVIRRCGSDAEWGASLRDAKAAPQPYPAGSDALARIEGVSAFRGTCSGIGSTAAAVGCCLACGSVDGHAPRDCSVWDSGRAWSAGDDDALVAACGSGDLVAGVESVANAQHRSARETLARWQQLVE